MRQKTFTLVASLMLAGLIVTPATAGITLRASKAPKAEPIQIVSYLSETNTALQHALLIHNIMNEMPMFQDVALTAENLQKQTEILKEMQKNIRSCNAKKMGKVFKDPETVWKKMVSAYEQRRQGAEEKIKAKKSDKLTMSLKEKNLQKNMGWAISRDIMLDVYQNPEKWGDVNQNESFPLWKDQIALFEKQWNQFYENLNTAYGVALKGRPAVDEETRHNEKKYNLVLAAHKAYVAQISEGKQPISSKIANEKPPKAPKPLPNWQEIVRLDPLTGKATPELPEPWKQMSENKFKNYTSGGEMSQFFDGKSLKPQANVASGYGSDLETEYNVLLAVDSMEKGIKDNEENQKKMIQPFIKKLEELGIDTKDFDISDRAQYVRVMKELKDLKKESIEEAYKYVEQLENQDRNNPDYVAKRNQAKAKKQARLSAEAQAVTSSMNDIVQISQMAPSVQQRLVLSALEKDENGSVHLTQTNAVNVDQ